MLINGFGVFAGFIIFSILFAFAALIISWIVQPKAPNKIKNTTYECGMKTFGDARIQFDVKYYMIALLFLFFDVEAVFLFPWAVVFNKLGLFALVEGFIFIFILFLGLIYVIKKEFLEWK
ncbi:MAG: NADH-quinone oxidoreductase subunit A [Candidatus Gastranaerophilaceae bacterium]|jgi:NADH-quinone oxidoreductase subunit A